METIKDVQWMDAQEICERYFTERVSAHFRAGVSIRINGGNWLEMTEHSDWREGKDGGWDFADQFIKQGHIFFVYPFECDRGGCPSRFQYGGYWACNSCGTHISTPEWWKIKVIKDGDAYCCIGLGFVNLQESNNYAFGNSFQDAINQYWHNHYNSLEAKL